MITLNSKSLFLDKINWAVASPRVVSRRGFFCEWRYFCNGYLNDCQSSSNLSNQNFWYITSPAFEISFPHFRDIDEINIVIPTLKYV